MVQQTLLDPKTGDEKFRYVKRRISGSLTFAAGAIKPDLPDAVLRATEIAKALRSGQLKLVSRTAVAPPPKPVPPPEPTIKRKKGSE
jgi:hypothetical protein